jgi:hypothetical protein
VQTTVKGMLVHMPYYGSDDPESNRAVKRRQERIIRGLLDYLLESKLAVLLPRMKTPVGRSVEVYSISPDVVRELRLKGEVL